MYPTEDVPKNIANLFEFCDLYNKEGLFPHQEYVRRFMSPYTPYKSILLYHSPGSGKSLICISISVDHYLHSSMRSLIITRGESGSISFKKQILQYADKIEVGRDVSTIFEIAHYLSLHNKVIEYSDTDVVDKFDNKIITFDEIHNIREIGNVDSVYKSIMRIIKLCSKSKFIFSSATPMVDSHHQMSSISNLLSNEYDDMGFVSFNSKIIEKPIVSYIGTLNDHIVPRIELVKMKDHQKREYMLEESTTKVVDIYKKLSHLALFSFPDNNKASDIVEIKTKGKVIPIDRKRTVREITFISYSIPGELMEFLSGEGLRRSSCKYHRLMKNISKSKGSIFVSIEEVHGSGLLLLARILEEHGYELYYGQPISDEKKRYTICVGSSDISPNMQERLDAFNSIENKNGSLIRILLGSRVIGESITLLNVRQFHSISPHWNYSKLNQAIGRVIRTKSHALLDKSDRTVDIYVYIADRTVDVRKLETCRSKQVLIEEQEELLKSRSIEKYSKTHKYTGQENVDNFLLYYMETYMDILTEQISFIFSKTDACDINFISKRISYPVRVIMDALFRLIISNYQIKGRMILREDRGTFFLYDNPSHPFHIIRAPPLQVTESVEEESDIEIVYNSDNALEYLRSINVAQKIHVLEEILSKGRLSPFERDILRILKYLFVKNGEAVYHILYYRDLGPSYKAVVPFPNKPDLRTRCLEHGIWRFMVDSDSEEDIISHMRNRYMDKIRSIEDLYCMISVIDNKMRLRRGFEEKDRRKTLKGRNLISLRKDILLGICDSLSIQYDLSWTVKDLIHSIEKHYIDDNRYIMI